MSDDLAFAEAIAVEAVEDFRKFPKEDVSFSLSGKDIEITWSDATVDVVLEKDTKARPEKPVVGDIFVETKDIVRIDDEERARRLEDPDFMNKLAQDSRWGVPMLTETLTVYEIWNGRGWIGFRPGEPMRMYIFEEESK